MDIDRTLHLAVLHYLLQVVTNFLRQFHVLLHQLLKQLNTRLRLHFLRIFDVGVVSFNRFCLVLQNREQIILKIAQRAIVAVHRASHKIALRQNLLTTFLLKLLTDRRSSSIFLKRSKPYSSRGIIEEAQTKAVQSERSMATWDLNRFVKTLAYFGSIPIVSSLDWLQHLLGSRPNPTVHFNFTKASVILLIGADNRIGQQVTQQLQQAGYLVCPAAGAPVAIDPNVSAIVCCTEDPNLDTSAIAAAQTSTSQRIFDFRQPDAEVAAEIGEVWGALDDVVMGGVSQSGFRLADASALFSGTVSTENSGGFASVRTRNFEPAIDLSDFAGIELRLKGDGSRYKFMLRSETRWDGVAYCASFDTIANQWTTVKVPFTDFIPVFRAKTVREAGSIDAGQIRSMQLMLSKFEYDGELNPHFTSGFFQLQVESIAAYRCKIPLVLVSSTGITLPEAPPGSIALRLKEVLKKISTP